MKSGVSVPQPVSFAVDDTEDVTTLRHLRRQARYFVLSRYHFGLQHKAPKVRRERPAEFELCITSMLFCEFAYNQRLVCNIFGVDCVKILTYWFNYVHDGISTILFAGFLCIHTRRQQRVCEENLIRVLLSPFFTLVVRYYWWKKHSVDFEHICCSVIKGSHKRKTILLLTSMIYIAEGGEARDAIDEKTTFEKLRC